MRGLPLSLFPRQETLDYVLDCVTRVGDLA